ncbi:hypothetical protein ACEPPN_004084 [Leptodophora sp. 'Broadleaf-Isolate-01']
MSTADWKQIEVTETISKAFPFRNTQTLADKENDAWLWSKSSMQQFRSGIDAEAHLEGLFNELDKYPERENQTPSHGKSCTGSEWGTQETSQSDAANLEDIDIRSTAAAKLRRSARDICSWTPAYSSDCDGLKGRSTWKELVRTFVTCVRDLEAENYELSHQLAKMRQNSTMIVGSTISPVTLRTIIMVRVMEANFGTPTRINNKTLLFTEMGNLSPIHIDALDVTLTPDRANQLRRLLPSGTAYRDLYDGIYIHTCTKCLKPRFRLNKANRYPLFRDLNEYPKLGDMLSYGEICSSCGLEALLRAIWRDWWHSLGNMVWLKHYWDQGCCTFDIMCEKDLVSILDSLGCQDVNDVEDYVKKYPLPHPF